MSDDPPAVNGQLLFAPRNPALTCSDPTATPYSGRRPPPRRILSFQDRSCLLFVLALPRRPPSARVEDPLEHLVVSGAASIRYSGRCCFTASRIAVLAPRPRETRRRVVGSAPRAGRDGDPEHLGDTGVVKAVLYLADGPDDAILGGSRVRGGQEHRLVRAQARFLVPPQRKCSITESPSVATLRKPAKRCAIR
jgi:hypothetical protein